MSDEKRGKYWLRREWLKEGTLYFAYLFYSRKSFSLKSHSISNPAAFMVGTQSGPEESKRGDNRGCLPPWPPPRVGPSLCPRCRSPKPVPVLVRLGMSCEAALNLISEVFFGWHNRKKQGFEIRLA